MRRTGDSGAGSSRSLAACWDSSRGSGWLPGTGRRPDCGCASIRRLPAWPDSWRSCWLTLLGIALLGHLLKGLFRLAGLGPIDAVGGLLLGVVKMALILSLLLGAFETVNRARAGWASKVMARAVLYKPVRELSRWVFPYLSRAAEKLADRENTSE